MMLTGEGMLDVVFVALIVVFFAASVGYALLCDKL